MAHLTDSGHRFVERSEENYVVTLLVDSGRSEEGRFLLSETVPSRRRLGLNSMALHAHAGAWIITGPDQELLIEVARSVHETTPILGTANVKAQWLLFGDECRVAERVLSDLIMSQVPAVDRLTEARLEQLHSQMRTLVSGFINRGGAHRGRFDLESLRWDLDEGLVRVPASLDDEAAPDWSRIEALDGPANRAAESRLDYWWESVFMAWWKGFW